MWLHGVGCVANGTDTLEWTLNGIGASAFLVARTADIPGGAFSSPTLLEFLTDLMAYLEGAAGLATAQRTNQIV